MYMVEELKYPEASAARRIKAMEALEVMPELVPAIEQGKLSLASVSQVEAFWQAQEKAKRKAEENQRAAAAAKEAEVPPGTAEEAAPPAIPIRNPTHLAGGSESWN